MTDPIIVQALEEFAREQGSVVTGALIVSRIIDPDTDIDWCQAQLAELAQFMPTDAGAVDVVHILQEQGFHGSDAYYKSENSALAHVLLNEVLVPGHAQVVPTHRAHDTERDCLVQLKRVSDGQHPLRDS